MPLASPRRQKSVAPSLTTSLLYLLAAVALTVTVLVSGREIAPPVGSVTLIV